MAAGPALIALTIAVVWLVAIVAGIGAGVALLRQRRTVLGASLLGGAVVVLLAPFAWIAWLFYGPDMRDTLESNAAGPGLPGFSAEVRHERLDYNGVDTVFRYGGGADALVAELADDYPEGWSEGSVWLVELDGITYWVEPSPGLEGGPLQPDVFLLTSDLDE